MRSVPALSALLCALSTLAPAGQGPAGASGPCSHVVGPIDSNGKTIGFTCENVGGSALLVWNASQLNSNITINGGIRAVNFYPGDFSIDGTFKSNGDLGFVGGGITVNGNITAASVLIVGASSSAAEVKSSLLGPDGHLTSSSTSKVFIESTAKIQATSGDVVIVGSAITNGGTLLAPRRSAMGSAILKTGSKLTVGWHDVSWDEGITDATHNFRIQNLGIINAKNIVLEAHRASNITTITNYGTLSAKEEVKFVTGFPGNPSPDGINYDPKSFGVVNTTGSIYAAKVTISPYYLPKAGGKPEDQDRPFNTTLESGRTDLKTAISGGVFGPTQDHTDTGGGGSAVITPASFTPTTGIVIPQLAASLSQMNATQQPKVKTLAVTSSSEQLRGEGKPVAPTSDKPRPKAKPVLVRGAFFGTKISATITSAQ